MGAAKAVYEEKARMAMEVKAKRRMFKREDTAEECEEGLVEAKE